MAEMKTMAKPLLEEPESSSSLSFHVKGMVCKSCVRKVEGAIQDLEISELLSVQVDLKGGRAPYNASLLLELRPMDASVEGRLAQQVKEAIEALNYEVLLATAPLPHLAAESGTGTAGGTGRGESGGNVAHRSVTFEFEVLGMKCGSCVKKAEAALRAADVRPLTLEDVSVNLLSESASVRLASPEGSPELSAVEDALRGAFGTVGLEATVTKRPAPQPPRHAAHTTSLGPYEFEVLGLKCGSCVKKAETAVRQLAWPSIAEVQVNLLAESATVHFAALLDENSLVGALNAVTMAFASVGLSASVTKRPDSEKSGSGRHRLEFELLGMTCASCVSTAETALKNAALPEHAHLGEVAVNLLAESAEVTLVGDLTPEQLKTAQEALVAAVEAVGYQAVAKALEVNTEIVEEELLLVGSSAVALDLEAADDLGTQQRALEDVKQVRGVVSVLPGRARGSSSQTELQVHVRRSAERERIVRELLWAFEDAGFRQVHVKEELRQSPLERAQRRRGEEALAWKRSFLIAFVLTVPVVLLMWLLSPMKSLEPLLMVNGIDVAGLLMFVLATPVQFGSGWVFYKEAFAGLRHKKLGMAAMVVLGTTAAYASSCLQLASKLLCHEKAAMSLDFDTSSLLITFVLMGKWLECRAKGSTGDAITALMALAPRTALLVLPTGEREVDAKLLMTGDLVKVLPGAKLPADGVVTSGSSAVDESALTGESLPIPKGPGDQVIGGTVNHGGVLQVSLQAVGANSALSQIVGLVEQAQSQRAPVQEFADRISGVFVPVVMSLSLATLVMWIILTHCGFVSAEQLPGRQDANTFSLMMAISVLVVACPCALGLAAPTAVMVGTGVGAQNGVLIKGGRALETAHHVQTVVLDKTGTITEGKPSVTDLELLEEGDWLADVSSYLKDVGLLVHPESQMSRVLPALWLASCAEKGSEHPLGQAVAKEGEKLIQEWSNGAVTDALLEPESFKALPGRGVEATVLRHRVYIGNMAWMAACGVDLDSDGGRLAAQNARSVQQSLEENGKTVIFVAVDQRLTLLIALADTVKAEAQQTIAALKRMGREVYMLTGDNARTARAVARQVGIAPEHVVAEVLPSGKSEKVKELQSVSAPQRSTRTRSSALFRALRRLWGTREVEVTEATEVHRFVAMVGDGVNDAPALAQADLGIAIGAGAEIAMEAADMVLVRSQLSDVVIALHLSSAIFHRIQLNFLFSLGYNGIGIPLAAGLFFALTGQPLAPFVSGGAMAMSSVSVVLSSLMLKRYKAPSVIVPPRPSCWTRLWAALGAGFGSGDVLRRELQEERCTVDSARLFVQGKAISCGALWGRTCDCHTQHGSCPCRRCKEHSSSVSPIEEP